MPNPAILTAKFFHTYDTATKSSALGIILFNYRNALIVACIGAGASLVMNANSCDTFIGTATLQGRLGYSTWSMSRNVDCSRVMSPRSHTSLGVRKTWQVDQLFLSLSQL